MGSRCNRTALPTRLLNCTILEMIWLSMFGKIESPMNSMSSLVSWSTNTWENMWNVCLFPPPNDYNIFKNNHNIYSTYHYIIYLKHRLFNHLPEWICWGRIWAGPCAPLLEWRGSGSRRSLSSRVVPGSSCPALGCRSQHGDQSRRLTPPARTERPGSTTQE